jgi:hypothetical protein
MSDCDFAAMRTRVSRWELTRLVEGADCERTVCWRRRFAGPWFSVEPEAGLLGFSRTLNTLHVCC